ncbi:MAG TPA: nucleoside diphosphate kinase regulator [bacterium]|nr:nucleoside diphosphate kinase regulator [bacterium]
MEKKPIFITKYDKVRLKRLIDTDLINEIKRAKVVDSKEIPDDVITMNSRFKLKDLDSGEESVYTLVFPEDADIYQNKISIYAPMGIALIGYQVGDVIEWPVPGGILRIKVLEILYQPEASGDFHL